MDKMRCDHCGHQWRQYAPVAETQPAISEPKTQNLYQPAPRPATVYRPASRACCPECGSNKTRTTSTRGRVRYHRCRDCGNRFKSVSDEG